MLCVASLVALFAALEVATRLFSRVTPPLLCNDPKVGTTFIPEFSGRVYVPEGKREVFLHFNSEGMRGGDVPHAKPPGVRRVAVIGDSMIAAIATDEEQTLVRRLEERLNNAATGTTYEVLNFGMSGSSTGQELVLYRQVVRNYQPDVVVCAFCVMNDLGDNCTRLTSNRGRIYFDLDAEDHLVELPFCATRAKLTSWLNRHSRFYVWQKGAVQYAINSLRRKAEALAASAGRENNPFDSGGQGIYCSEPDETLAYAWRVTAKLIETMHAEVEADGARFVLAVLPTGAQVCDDAWADEFGAGANTSTAESTAASSGAPLDKYYPDRRLREICDRIGAQTVLMTDRFREAAPHHSLDYPDEWLYYDGFGHFNDRGNDVAAAVLFEALINVETAPADKDQAGDE